MFNFMDILCYKLGLLRSPIYKARVEETEQTMNYFTQIIKSVGKYTAELKNVHQH